MATRNELIAAVGKRYRAARSGEKTLILDEFVAVTGYHRKHAVRVLRKESDERQRHVQGRRVYDEAFRRAAVVLWEASDRICGKRLVAALPGLVEAMERCGHLDLDPPLRAQLMGVSAATLDRILAPVRAGVGMSRRTRRALDTSVKRRVPVRTFGDWGDPEPGFLEADFVAHCGGSMSGRFIHTLTVTDIASGWTECLPLVVREQNLVVQALDILAARLPMGLKGFDTDNDGAFINETVIDYCTANGIAQTRSRPRRKNDQAWVEQKNGAVVRRLVGYGRFSGLGAASILTELFASARLYVNFFQPSFKLKEKVRIGAKVKKVYHTPATPCDRLLGDERTDEAVKCALRQQRADLDPIELLKTIREAQKALVAHVESEGTSDAGKDQAPADVASFVAQLPDLWRRSDARQILRKPSKAPRTWRTRVDPFEGVWSDIEAWLVAEPDLPAKDLLERLCVAQPERFSGKELRTLQRRVKVWRSAMAERLLSAGTSVPGA